MKLNGICFLTFQNIRIAGFAGELAAGIVQYAAEYYPSGRSYGGFHNDGKAPAHLEEWDRGDRHP